MIRARRRRAKRTDASGTRTKVVVIGAGFGGLSAARELAGRNVDVMIVDQHNFHTFQPLLYQVATAGLDPADVAFPVRPIFGKFDNVEVRHARVTSIETDHRNVELSDGSSLSYDALVVATGATANFFGIEGAEERGRPLYTLRDARVLRNSVLTVLEAADAHPVRFSDGAPSFVIVGGGATGVEIAGAIVELLDLAIRRDRLRLDRARSRVVIVDGGERLLPGFRERSSGYAAATVAKRGIEVRLGSAVASVDAHAVHLADGSSVPADLVVWAGGITVDGTIAASLPVAAGRGGRVVVDGDMTIAGHPEIFVVGDAAAVPSGHKNGEIAPQLAQVAIQSGRHAARTILVRTEGKDPKRFSYVDKGTMATIGRRAAVAELMLPRGRKGPVFRGTPGWLAWLGLHLVYLIGFRNRLVVCLNWLWRYVGWAAGPRIIVEDDPYD